MIWHPIKGYEHYSINKHGKVMGKSGKILRLRNDAERPTVSIQTTLGQKRLDITKAFEENILSIMPEIKPEERHEQTVKPGELFQYTFLFTEVGRNQIRRNYSENEVIFHLEIKGRKGVKPGSENYEILQK